MERRVFAVPSARAWGIVRERLKELGLSVDKTDTAHQLALTQWETLNKKAPAWLANARPWLGGTVVLDDMRARFLVFVSPFAVRAHVYVGSIFDGVPSAGDVGRDTGGDVRGPRARGALAWQPRGVVPKG